MPLKQAILEAWYKLPENSIKKAVRNVVRAVRPVPFPDSFVAELEMLTVNKAGLADDGVPFVELSDAVIFYGSLPLKDESQGCYYDDVAAYRRLPTSVRAKIPVEAIRLALDIVLRYKYAHAMPGLVPPYPFEVRHKHWFGQHSDTIADLDMSATDKQALVNRFDIKPGHCVVDAGACFGFGALRYSKLVGNSGKVIAVEVDPEIQAMFARNMAANNIDNVELIRCGVWNTPGKLELHVGSIHRQDNSLHGDVYPSDTTISVPTKTLDMIVEESGVQRVDHVSITLNTAEVEAFEGLSQTMHRDGPTLSIAGWLVRDGRKVHEHIVEQMANFPNYHYAVGKTGRVLAWCDHEDRD